MYLLDVCGHGVGAALLSVSVMNVLRSQSLPDVDFRKPAQVLDALNNAFPMERQNNMFFTLWYGVYNARERTITYASGGHPPALLFWQGGCAELSTHGMVVGGVPDTRYKEAVASVAPQARLYVFSDGVYEIEDAESGRVMGFADFKNKLESLPQTSPKILPMFEYAVKKQNSDKFKDDYSMCEIAFK